MRKAIIEASSGNVDFSAAALDQLLAEGYVYVQVKGFTIDKHCEYVDPHTLVLVPLKALPTDPVEKDIYEPIQSPILYQWATEVNEFPHIIISKKGVPPEIAG